MKRFYLTLFLCLQAIFLMAQTDDTTVYVCLDIPYMGIGDFLTPKVQSKVEKIIVQGHFTNEAFPYIDDCPNLKILDLRDAILDSIPQYSLVKDKPLTDIYLPKKKILFNANSVKNTERIKTDAGDSIVHNDITVHVTGYFPLLDGDYSLDYEYEDRYDLWQLLFTVEKGNKHCIGEEDDDGLKTDITPGSIISADRDTLFHYHFNYLDVEWDDNPDIDEELPYPFYFRVAEDFRGTFFGYYAVAPYAFGFNKLAADFHFGGNLHTICRHAFDGILPVHVTPFHDVFPNVSDYYDNGKCAFIIEPNYPDDIPPRIEDPMLYSPEESPIIIFYQMCVLRYCLESSCAWAGTKISLYEFKDMEDYNYSVETNQNPSPYYDKDGNLLTYITPGILNQEWFNGIMNIEDIVFRTEGTDSITTADIEIDNGSHFMFVIYWRNIVVDNGWEPWGSYHYAEHFDTIYSPITDWEDLIYEIVIVDDNGNECFSAKRKRGDGNTEHLSGTLSNVPTSEQGELKSRTNGRRYGSSPWYTQRINFDGTGIRPLKPSSQSNTLFDLQGRQVTTPSKGIYIKEGKKVLVE